MGVCSSLTLGYWADRMPKPPEKPKAGAGKPTKAPPAGKAKGAPPTKGPPPAKPPTKLEEAKEYQQRQLLLTHHQQRNPSRKKTWCHAVSVGESLQRTELRNTRRSAQRPQQRT